MYTMYVQHLQHVQHGLHVQHVSHVPEVLTAGLFYSLVLQEDNFLSELHFYNSLRFEIIILNSAEVKST